MQTTHQREETKVDLNTTHSNTTRRTVLKGIGAGLAASALGAPMVARAQSAGTIKIGFVTPATGPLALFGETDGWAAENIQTLLKDGL